MCELCVGQACGKFNELTNIGANQQQAPAQQNQGANKPSTSGQGGANQQQTPAQQNQPAGQGQQDSGSK
jgi:hypothetical protein